MYRKETALPERIAGIFGPAYRWAYNKFYFDELYLFVTKKIIFRYISAPVAWFDRHIVDGTMNLIAEITQRTSYYIRRFQSGQLQKYAFVFISGALLLALLVIFVWK